MLIKYIAVAVILVNSIFSEPVDVNKYLPKEWRGMVKNVKVHSDIGMTIYDFLRRYNYHYENHWISTEDGYKLLLHRIPYGQNQSVPDTKPRPVVLIMHGLGASSLNWIIKGPNDALGLALADQGYDVWLGNTRGNRYSRNHERLNPDIDTTEFWDFSFELTGRYDVAAKIDYILKQTGQQKLFYIGHSQGTSQFFALTSLRPEYNDKVALMTALAPIAYLEHLSSPILRLAADNIALLQTLVNIFNIHEFSQSPLTNTLVGLVCAKESPLKDICSTYTFLTSGFDHQEFDEGFLPLYLSHVGVGMSINMLLHFGQEIKSHHFRRYDYGREKNLKIYHTAAPPDFNLSAVTAPVALYYAKNDFLSSVKDVERLISELPNVNKTRLIENRRWNHIDFIVANDVHDVINKDIIAHLQTFIDDGALDPTTSEPMSSTTERIKGSSDRIISQSVYTLIMTVMLVLYY
uniref:Lipase 3-like n=1 Tax=Diabrotica virgifera virgifera TaxID=50390 RepID=A0A6P7FLX9_DIAVI